MVHLLLSKIIVIGTITLSIEILRCYLEIPMELISYLIIKNKRSNFVAFAKLESQFSYRMHCTNMDENSLIT